MKILMILIMLHMFIPVFYITQKLNLFQENQIKLKMLLTIIYIQLNIKKLFAKLVYMKLKKIIVNIQIQMEM